MTKKRVVVGMSGGVDSSLAALLLKQQGYDVVGLFMRNWHEKDDGGCCTADEDFYDVRSVCNKLDIPYYSVDFADKYYDKVFRLFVEEYKKGRTPNPDVLCNKEIKFGPFVNQALSMGADYIATGHYCDIDHNPDGYNYLLRAVDDNKDQTYFLNQVTSKQLEKVLFPLGSLTKPQVRELAEKYGLSTAQKKDSTGICFIGERNFRQFLASYIPMQQGKILTLDGKEVGKHNGVFYYTIGQRKGLGIGGGGNGEAWFVVDKDVDKNILYVSQGDQSPIYHSHLECDEFNFITTKPQETSFRAQVRIRHRQPLQDATVRVDGDKVSVDFDVPQRAIAEGQYAVVYVGRICIGGGVIERKSK
ncbi:MAG: tRNA 2-thiouridine(34) synthase MnmA [Christensenellales bacterium]